MKSPHDSDHWPFATRGIPSLWIVARHEPPTDALEAARRRIHSPSDDMSRSFRWDVAETLTRLHLLIGHEVANQPNRPQWNAGDVLGEQFGR